MVKLSSFHMQTTSSELDRLTRNDPPRPYLGCSQIGHKCPRYLWFSFRWCFTQQVSARLRRLFWRGHREEPEIIKELNSLGIICYDDQAECNFVEGHMSGHCDGKAIGVLEAPKTVHLLEFKTASDSKFKQMQKKGVEKANPVYYAQLQIYMLGLKLTRALFIMVNKNDDTFYIERVYFDKSFAKDLVRKGGSIIMAEAPDPIRKPFSRTWFECKWCDAKAICMDKAPVNKTCRTCVHADILNGGKWGCNEHVIELATAQQLLACGKYKQVEIE